MYGESLTSPDIKDNQLQIILPTSSTPAPRNDEAARTDSASDDGKKRKHKGQKNKEFQRTKDAIIEGRELEKLENRIKEESEGIENFKRLLKLIPIDDYSKSIDFIDQYLLKFEIPDNRLNLFKKKLRFQRKYLQSLKRKRDLTSEEKSKLDLLQIAYFATMTEMVSLEKLVDVFDKKKKYMEELVDPSPLDHEIWYRFQLEKINSRIPRREQGIPDDRIHDFIPDKWQVDFLDAVDKRQSIIIVAPTASGSLTFFIIFIF
jgi:superfamily II RNA helicase